MYIFLSTPGAWFVHPDGHVRVRQGFLLYRKKKKPLQRQVSLISRFPSPGSSCMCRSVWGMLLQCLIGMKTTCRHSSLPGAGERASTLSCEGFYCFVLLKKKNPENLEECLCEVAGVLQGQLHRCQVCCTYFLQIPAAGGGGGGGGGAQRWFPFQREQPLEQKEKKRGESRYYCAAALSPKRLSNHLSKETEGISS